MTHMVYVTTTANGLHKPFQWHHWLSRASIMQMLIALDVMQTVELAYWIRIDNGIGDVQENAERAEFYLGLQVELHIEIARRLNPQPFCPSN